MVKLTAALVSTCLLVAGLPAPVAGQQPPGEAAPAAGAREARTRMGVALLDAAMAAAQRLTLPENRIRAQLTAAELVWKHDERRARAYYAEGAKSLAAGMGELTAAEPELIQKLQTLFGLRQEAVMQLAGRDAGLAVDFFDATRPPAELGPTWLQRQDLQLQWWLGQALARADPKRALALALRAADGGGLEQLPGMLEALKSSDRSAATALASRMVEKLADGRLLDDDGGPGVVAFLLRDALAPAGGEGAGPLLDDAALRTLLDVLIGTPLSGTAPFLRDQHVSALASTFAAVQDLLPEVERRAPDRARRLRQRAAEVEALSAGVPGVQRPPEAGADAVAPTPDEYLAAAREASASRREEFYRLAFSAALNSGDVDRARQIASDDDAPPALRAEMRESVDRTRVYAALEGQQMDEAAALARSLRRPEERAAVLTQLAAQAFDAGDRDRAARLLGEAEAQAGDGGDGRSLQARVAVAYGASRIDPARAAAILEPAIDRLNGLIAAAAALDGFGCDRLYEGGELRLRQEGTIGAIVHQTAGALGALAAQDAERARAAAMRFERPEPQVLALLRVAAALLAE